MNKLYFPTLELIALSESDFLLDDGFVPSIEDHCKKVYGEFMGTSDGYELVARDTSNWCGAYMHLNMDGQNIWVIFYTHSNPTTECYRKAHEETHVLHALGKIELLQHRFSEQGLSIDLSRYYDYDRCSQDERELVADIGALLGLENNGVDIMKIPLGINVKSVETALCIYQAAIIKRDSAQ